MTKSFSLLGFVFELHAIDRDLEALFGEHGHNFHDPRGAC